uniref:H15 domain-containing protein n=1 Tax=Rhabditophanes sp. KR3021 TaxID=114890 RepID=A0AC35UDG7_9BILA
MAALQKNRVDMSLDEIIKMDKIKGGKRAFPPKKGGVKNGGIVKKSGATPKKVVNGKKSGVVNAKNRTKLAAAKLKEAKKGNKGLGNLNDPKTQAVLTTIISEVLKKTGSVQKKPHQVAAKKQLGFKARRNASKATASPMLNRVQVGSRNIKKSKPATPKVLSTPIPKGNILLSRLAQHSKTIVKSPIISKGRIPVGPKSSIRNKNNGGNFKNNNTREGTKSFSRRDSNKRRN